MTRQDTSIPTGDRNEISIFRPEPLAPHLPVIVLSPGFGGTRELEGSALRLWSGGNPGGDGFRFLQPVQLWRHPGCRRGLHVWEVVVEPGGSGGVGRRAAVG